MEHATSPVGPAVSVSDLEKSFSGRLVVRGISFDVAAGRIFSLLGPNGAGKTTSIRMLYGSLRPDGGHVAYFGRDFALERRELKLMIGVCSQNDTLDYDLSVRRNLEIFGRYYHQSAVSAQRRAAALIARFNLDEYAERRPRELSGGLKRRLQIARALINRPRVLFLDEPTVGLDPHVRRELWDLLHGFRREGMTIILTTHYMEEAETLADDLMILNDGVAIERGAPAEVVRRHFDGWMFQVEDEPEAVAWLKADGLPFDRAYGRLTVPANAETIHRLDERFRGRSTVRRRPNLDDLFVKLTGRRL